jgi:hypothetical protein
VPWTRRQSPLPTSKWWMVEAGGCGWGRREEGREERYEEAGPSEHVDTSRTSWGSGAVVSIRGT